MEYKRRILKKKPDLIYRVVDEETILLDPESGYMHLLNSTGKEIWELIDEVGKDFDDILAAMVDEYGHTIDLDVLKDDLEEFIDTLLEHGVIIEEGKSAHTKEE